MEVVNYLVGKIKSKLFPFNFIIERLFILYRKNAQNYPVYGIYSFSPVKEFPPNNEVRFLQSYDDIGIILQGPIKHDFSFTYRTVVLYLSNFGGCQVVLSTWEDEDLSAFQELIESNGNFHLVLNEKPINEGISHINFQIHSTIAGIKKMEQLGIKYSIKSRTDQCMFDPFALIKLRDFFLSLERPEKLIFLSLGTFLFRPYSPSDFFQFGLTSSVKEYWDLPLDARTKREQPDVTGWSLRNFSKFEVCEVYPAVNFLRKKGETLDFTLINSISMFKKHFSVIDPDRIGLVWDKYTYKRDRYSHRCFENPYQELNEGVVLILEDSLDHLAKLDYLLDLPVLNRDFEQ